MKITILTTALLMLLFVVAVNGQSNTEKTKERAKIYEPLIAAAAARYQVDPHLLWTVAYLESRFQHRAVSYKHGKPCAFGLMQFIPATARKYDLYDPHDPRKALDAAARYLFDLLRRFDGQGDLVLAAYNAGEGTVEAFRYGRKLLLPSGKVINPGAIRTGGIPPYKETQRYVAQGIRILKELTRVRRFPNNTVKVNMIDREAIGSIYVSNFNSLAPQQPDTSKKKKARQGYSLYAN